MGSPHVDRRGSSGRRRAHDGGNDVVGEAWACACGCAWRAHRGRRHTAPDTWATTSTPTPGGPRTIGAHEVSKPQVRAARWCADRIGPTVMAAPQCGHVQVARVAVSVRTAAVASVAGGAAGRASSVRASATRAVATGVGEKARLPDAHEAARQHVLDDAPEKLHHRQRHRAALPCRARSPSTGRSRARHRRRAAGDR